MKNYIRKVTSLDQNSIDLGNSIASRLGLSFSSLIRLLINKESLTFNAQVLKPKNQEINKLGQ